MVFENISIFDVSLPTYKIQKSIRLIELFAGVGSQAMALRNIGADFEHYRVVEFDKYAIASYNAIHGTKFETMDITKVKGEDLSIIDTDKYEYIMTYSFPCQDLSVAGKMKGMTKGSDTRSGLLWEVERLLNEVKDLPQVLLMENVPQVISDANIKDFRLWQKFLENKGYSNYTEVLNAKNYGVAQNRERCFMVSILGNYNYKFPQPIPLTKTMKNYLEDEVDEKYYINSEKAQILIQQLIDSKQLKDNINCVDGSINEPKTKEVSNCIKARYDAGISNFKSDGGMVVEVNQLGNIMPGTNRENPNQGRVYDKEALAPTLSCMGGGNREPMIVASRGRNKENPSDRTPGIELEQTLEPNKEGICNTLTSVQKDNLVLEPKLVGGIGEKNWGKQWRQGDRVYDSNAIAMALNAQPVGNTGGNSYLYMVEEPAILTPKRTEYGKAVRKDYEKGNIQESRHNMTELQPRNDGISNTLTTVQKDNLLLEPQYRIRKLTPLECWRLMSFTDEDFHKAEQVNSNTQLYKQSGNSIVVNVLEAIFKNLF